MSDSIDRLHTAVMLARNGDPASSRTAGLFRAGRGKISKKVAEEAIEVVIDALQGDPEAVIKESADLIYNLVVLWVAAGIEPKQVWTEMERRECLLGMAEKLPKLPKRTMGRTMHGDVEPAARRKVVALENRRARKHR